MIELEQLAPGVILCRAHLGPVPAGGYPAAFVLCPSHDGTEATVKGMVGRMTRQLWREFLQVLVDLRVRTLVAHRKDGHGVPLGVRSADDWYRNDVAELVARFARPDATTDLAPL